MSMMSNLLAKGFRPFFLLAAFFAASYLPVWLFRYTGQLNIGGTWLPATWHGHEMIFGFALAVIAGFLLTAVNRWTGRPTATGRSLAGLCVLWVAGRAAMLLAASLPGALVATVDLAFVVALGFFVGRPIIQARSARNYKFLPIFAVLFGTNLVMHLSAMGVVDAGIARLTLLTALDMVILIILIVTGRIVPMFTRNATGAQGLRTVGWLEKLIYPLVIASIILQFFWPQHTINALVALIAGLAIGARQLTWGGQHTLKKPILWVLHVGHAWVAIGFILRALAIWLPQVSSTASSHALTVGSIGMLIIGMMTRVSLGHTGRPITASWAMSIAFGLVALAALGRTALPIILPAYYLEWVMLSGVLFALAFGAFLVEFTPILIAPRPDGKPG